MRAFVATAVLLGLSLSAPASAKGSIDFTVRDLSGKYVRLSDYKGKLVEISFWATFCKVCQKKLRHLDKWYRKYKSKGYVVLAVSVDGPETASKVKPITRRYKLSFPVLIDKESRISKLFNPKRATPFSVYIKDGKKIKVREGFQLSEVGQMEKELVALLKR
jgi:peroxiredoxin